MTRFASLAAAGLLLAAAFPAVAQAPPAKAPAKAAPAAAAPQWVVVPGQSRIAFSTRWAGQAVNGTFRQWAADIRFDPARLAASKAIVTVQTGSAATGMKDPDDNLPSADFFNVRQFPAARYETSAIRSLGGNRYVADGTLTLKGVAYRLALPFTLTIQGNNAVMSGQATLDRIALRLGVDSDSSAEWVAREVTLNVQVRATRR
jgi:polyisoprenoid-binding protein YceI